MLKFSPVNMVSIRLQRTGRRRHAQFRVVVQDSRRTPTSGRVIANLGFYNPHTKEHAVDLEKAAVYLQNGAQPSERMVKFFIDNKVALPAWIKPPKQKAKVIRHPDKLRRNRPVTAEEPPAAPVETAVAVETSPAEAAAPAEASASEAGEAAPVETQAEEETEEAAEGEEEEQSETAAAAEETAADDQEPEEETEQKKAAG